MAAAKKQKPISTPRVQAMVARLTESGGKRVLTDFDAESAAALQKLLESGYAENQKQVVMKAVREAAKNLEK